MGAMNDDHVRIHSGEKNRLNEAIKSIEAIALIHAA